MHFSFPSKVLDSKYNILKVLKLITSDFFFLPGGMENIEQATMNKYKTGIDGCISDLILDTDYHVKLVTMSTSGRNIDHCG